MRVKISGMLAAVALFACMACSSSQQKSASYEDQVKNALTQAELTDVNVSEDKDKNIITLSGTVHSETAKQDAARVAQAAAGGRSVVNEIAVRPVGAESEAKDIASNTDDAIEQNYKAALIAQGLDKDGIDYDAKNGVLTLKGKVKSPSHRAEAVKLAQATPNVQQVVNEIETAR